MKVLLVYPFRDDAYHKVGFLLPPMGIAYIASALRGCGHGVSIRDFNVDRSKPDYSNYDIVGISMDTSRYKSGLMIAAEAKEAGCTVVAGGPHVSFMDKEALDTGIVDFVVRGEGEATMCSLLNAIEEKSDLNAVRGISFMQGKTLVRTENAPEFEDIEDLIPARDLLDMGKYRTLELGKRKVTPVFTSRGCPYGCDFCVSSEFTGRKWRARSPRKVVDEIEHVMKTYGFNGFAFLDDNFSMNAKRVVDICDEIIRRKLDIYWWCFSRADLLLKNEDMVGKMSKAGCRYIFIGLESQSQETLDSYKKGITREMAKSVIDLLRSHKISVQASFIIGHVGETREMAMETIRFARDINPDAVQFSILTPYPGTKLFARLRDRITTYDWDLYDCLHCVVRTDHMSAEELQGLLKKAYMNFYLTPNKIMAGLLSGIRGRGIKISSILKIIKGAS